MGRTGREIGDLRLGEEGELISDQWVEEEDCRMMIVDF
jgi:hypothetical protein